MKSGHVAIGMITRYLESLVANKVYTFWRHISTVSGRCTDMVIYVNGKTKIPDWIQGSHCMIYAL